MPCEIWEFRGELVEVFDKEHFPFRACAVPERDFSIAILQPLKLIEDVAAHRCHAGSAADENHFLLGLAGEKLSERA